MMAKTLEVAKGIECEFMYDEKVQIPKGFEADLITAVKQFVQEKGITTKLLRVPVHLTVFAEKGESSVWPIYDDGEFKGSVQLHGYREQKVGADVYAQADALLSDSIEYWKEEGEWKYNMTTLRSAKADVIGDLKQTIKRIEAMRE